MNEMQNYNKIKEAIVETIAFFDLFDYPLTAWEVWKYLPGIKIGYDEFVNVLYAFDFENKIEIVNSFYILTGRREIIAVKMKRYYYTDKKFERAIRLFKFFKYFPGIKMIAVGNLIGAHNLKEDGDIDLFIVTETGRIWTVRFFLAVVMEIFGLRPRLGKEKDKICLSFFVSENNLDLKSLMLKDDQGKINDPYFIHWLAGLIPIYDIGGIYEKLITANNYIFDLLPNWKTNEIHHERQIMASSVFWQKFSSSLVKYFEKYLKNWQIKRFPSVIKDLLNKDTRVVVGDDIIKLHVNDRREEFRKNV